MRPTFKGLIAELTPVWLRRNGAPRQLRETATNIEAGRKRPEPTVTRRQGAYRPPPPRIDDITHTL
jgi:hypothetical protein